MILRVMFGKLGTNSAKWRLFSVLFFFLIELCKYFSPNIFTGTTIPSNIFTNKIH